MEMTTTTCIYLDSHPAGDFLVKEFAMTGDHTSAREIGRAETLEGARALLPEEKTMTRVGRQGTDDARLLETWL
jgi:hypothetical protein